MWRLRRAGLEPAECDGRLVLDAVTFAYHSRPTALVLRRVSLRVMPGTFGTKCSWHESIAPIRATAAHGLPAQRATPQRRAASRRGAAVGADVKRKAQNQRTRRRPATRTCGGADCVGLCCRRDARAYRPQRRWEEHARAAARAVPRPIERRGRARRRRLPHAQHALAPRAARVRIRTLTAIISTLIATFSSVRYVEQEPTLFDRSVLENIAYGRANDESYPSTPALLPPLTLPIPNLPTPSSTLPRVPYAWAWYPARHGTPHGMASRGAER